MSSRSALLLALTLTSAALAAEVAPQKFESGGVSVEMLTARPMEGEDVELRFAIRSADGTSLNGIRPAAWIDQHNPQKDGGGCKEKIQAFLGGTLRARPVVDLNSYYVITLNAEASIAVIDPLIGFGGSKLLTAVTLQSPGADWVLSRDQRRLFVSMPLVNRVAVIDTEKWDVVQNLDVPLQPGRLVLHDDGRVWVASDRALSILDPRTSSIVKSIPLGPAPHQLAFTPDGKRAVITNGDGKVAIVDAVKGVKLAELVTGASPSGVATSSLSAAVYVIHNDGAIAVIDANTREITKRIEAKPGLNSIQFAPGGRWGFVTNAKENVVHVIDSSTATIVTTATDVGLRPDQVAFTDDFAYVRAADSDQVKMIRLAALGKDIDANIATFPGGQLPPSAANVTSFASAIVPAPEPKSVLVANPADRVVYYYSEGMAAPMGKFSAVRRSPKAALVIDRSLRETSTGVFTIRTTAPPAGRYDVAFFLNEPRVVHCFDWTVRPDPNARQLAEGVKIEPLLDKKPIVAGQELEVKFRLSHAATSELRRDVRDVRALAFRAPGDWQQRMALEPTDDGLYRMKLTVPKAGVYYVFLESNSMQLNLNDGRPLIFQASER